jgi:DNA (cytosine-5)-methyltransferase 1
MIKLPIPIIDLFAGPGGLGEGFASVQHERSPAFDIRLSIEKDAVAHKTLVLRAVYRALKKNGRAPDAYYQYLRGEIDRVQFLSHPVVADAHRHALSEARCIELGKDSHKEVDALIHAALKGHKDWVLIGGPPCQAYSMAGRSRRTGDDTFHDDPKHFLYKEYLRIIQQFKPAVFVMENVKGMLSSKHDGEGIFEKIISDLSAPGYEIRSFVKKGTAERLDPSDFIIRSENYGVPQMRHRVILLGIRRDRKDRVQQVLAGVSQPVTVRDVIGDMPRVRSRLSKEADSPEAWITALNEAQKELASLSPQLRKTIKDEMSSAVLKASGLKSTGGQFVKCSAAMPKAPQELSRWFMDNSLGGVCQHETRSHIRGDLHRYLFSSCYAKSTDYSPKLKNMPDALLPNHRNVGDITVPFDDRFRVQLYKFPSTTVVSHISKDGHYYIHPDPSQCRSLTVREAARLQTFPDNYFFEGGRTQQYHQVGNAVPPFLAKQLGNIVKNFLVK